MLRRAAGLLRCDREAESLVHAEAAARQAIADEHADSLEISGVVRRLQAMVAAREDTLADVQAAQTQEEQSVEALKLMSEEMEQRSTAIAAEHAAMAALQQQHSAMLAQRAACGELEQQETLARMELMEQQAGGAVRLAERQPSMAARLSEAQSAAHANRVQCESLEQVLEESKEALASKERDMEALRDAQSDADAGVQQREVVRTEAERRAVIASEHRAALNALRDAEESGRAVAMRQEAESLVHAEAAARQAIADEHADSL